MQYAQKLIGDPVKDFQLFVGDAPAPDSSPDVIASVVSFFTKHFGSAVYAPNDEDEVINFCQMVPAGAYGSARHYQSVRSCYPDYTDSMEQAINAAWFAGAGE